jgi:predicted metal-binding protein
VCQGVIEIWTDEKKGKCPQCGTVVYHHLDGHLTQKPPLATKCISDYQINHLVDTAKGIGASDARAIFSSEIMVEEHLASLCNTDPQCENYGLSASCPPHVQGPDVFRQWLKKSTFSIVVRIDLPTEILFSNNRRGVMQLLQKIVAGVEQEAIALGFSETKSFAGGSCKNLFCREEHSCRVITEKGSCRNPDLARPSMSGFGVNVAKMLQVAGWPLKMGHQKEFSEKDDLSWVAGLIVISNVQS